MLLSMRAEWTLCHSQEANAIALLKGGGLGLGGTRQASAPASTSGEVTGACRLPHRRERSWTTDGPSPIRYSPPDPDWRTHMRFRLLKRRYLVTLLGAAGIMIGQLPALAET